MKKENGVVKYHPVILNSIQDLQRRLLLFINNKRGRSRIKYGMTSLFNNGGFTLIELLVVVLIIGILAAVAVPQYQRAVEKSRAAQAITLLRTTYEAAETYYLTHGQWPTQLNQLDIMPPWTGNLKWHNKSQDSVSNADWALEISQPTDGTYEREGVNIGRISGPYQGAGFAMMHKHFSTHIPTRILLCAERVGEGIKFNKEPGDYCNKLFNASKLYESPSIRLYSLP